MSQKRVFKPAPLDEATVAQIKSEHRIPDIGRAIRIADQPVTVDRPHHIKARVSAQTYLALQRHILELKAQGTPATIDYLIASGLKAIGVAVDSADLQPDRRKS